MTNDDAERAALIAGLKGGDRVLIDTSTPGQIQGHWVFVKRITPLYIVTVLYQDGLTETKYNKKTGSLVARHSYWGDKIAAPSFVLKFGRHERFCMAADNLERAAQKLRKESVAGVADSLRYALSVVEELAKETPDAP